MPHVFRYDAEEECACETVPSSRSAAQPEVKRAAQASGATYFIYRGELVGFEYELAQKCAADRDLRLELVVPPSRDDLLPWLIQGKGDVVAASLRSSVECTWREGVAFSL